MNALSNDLRFTVRQMRKSPGFTAVAILTLALGIGASTAIYSVIRSLVLDPVPGREPGRLMEIAEQDKKAEEKGRFYGVGPPTLQVLRANQDWFDDLAWCTSSESTRRTDEFVEEVMGAEVSPNFFSFLGTRPLLGRTFAPDEITPTDRDGTVAGDSVLVLGYGLWQSVFGGDPTVLGRTLELGKHRFTVIGVMPRHFKFPFGSTQYWMAVKDPPVRPDIGIAANFQVLVRLKSGMSPEPVQAMLGTLSQRVLREFSEHRMYKYQLNREGWTVRMRPLRDAFSDPKLQRTLVGLLSAIGFVLLIVCANIANLMLAKAENRQQELAVRAALGAGRFRLLRQLFTESVLLAMVGGAGGLLCSWGGVRALLALVPDWKSQLKPVQLDGPALVFTLLAVLGTSLLFGLAPAWRAYRTPAGQALKQGEARATLHAGWRRYRAALVITEVALTLVLLVGAGLMLQSVARLLRVNPGFDPENLLRVTVRLPWEKYSYDRPRERNAMLAALHEHLSALPGVAAVGIDKQNFPRPILVEERAEPLEVLQVGCGVEESDLFRAMRVQLQAGRLLRRDDIIRDKYFHQTDLDSGSSAVVINESLARLAWPGEVAVGKSFRMDNKKSKRRYEVVGVVGDIRHFSYAQKVEPAFYRPYQEFDLAGLAPAFLIRVTGAPAPLIPAIRRELKALEGEMRTPDIRVVRQALYEATQPQRTYMLYLVIFAVVGLTLAAIGIFGVLAYSVARRTREIGIRMAVGADRGQVLGMILGEGARLLALGVVVGIGAAAGLTRFLQHQLFDVSPTDPLVFAAVALVLVSVGLLACFMPARRAASTNPMEALRQG